MTIRVISEGSISERELDIYKQRGIEKYGNSLKEMTVRIDEDNVELTYYIVNPSFERVRRITGYLVGTLDRWNDAKKAEEKDRVKHEV